MNYKNATALKFCANFGSSRLVMEEASKYIVVVDLSRCGCDNVLSQQTAKHDFKDDESWNNIWADLCGDIGIELKDDKWEEKYDLFDKKNKNSITKLNQFVATFENVDASNLDNIASFYVGVKLSQRHIAFFFLFFHIVCVNYALFTFCF